MSATPSSIPPPELTAANEGTVAAIFNAMQLLLTYELDGTWADDGDEPGRFEFRLRKPIRETLLAPAGEDATYSVDPGELPDYDSYEPEDWNRVVESRSDRILWDADYDDDDLYTDKPPELSEFLKRTGDIPDGYFSTVVREPAESEMEAVWKRLKALARKS